jgi:NitT/TauT family transport system ATP-binding protein
MMHKIEVDNLSVSYNEGNKRFAALADISFTVEPGQFISIIGSSGCGKSTLLNVLGGLLAPSGGRVSIDGVPVTGPEKNRSMVFQHYSLFPWMTAKNNVVFGLKHAKTKFSGKEIKSRANSFLEKVGLENFKDKFPDQLSGGMQQRVAIARALAMDTEILLMDEPFGAVDAKNRSLLQELLLKLWEGNQDGLVFPLDETVARPVRERKTVVFITHDIDEAILMSDRIIMLSNSPGRISRELEVSFPRPRSPSALAQTPEYAQLRNELIALFYKDFGSDI